MTPDDESRHDLFVALERDTSRETAAALMRHIPPTGWPEFATKADIATTKSDIAVLKSDIAVLRAEMQAIASELRVEIRDQTRRFLFWLVPLVVGGMGASITLAARAG